MKTFGRVLLVAGAVIAAGAASAADVSAPRDVGTGMATGKRMHKPLTFTMDWSSRSAASADCTAQHGTLAMDGGKFVCTVDVDSDASASAVCAKVTAAGAVCKP